MIIYLYFINSSFFPLVCFSTKDFCPGLQLKKKKTSFGRGNQVYFLVVFSFENLNNSQFTLQLYPQRDYRAIYACCAKAVAVIKNTHSTVYTAVLGTLYQDVHVLDSNFPKRT